jgi:hypothetical protein
MMMCLAGILGGGRIFARAWRRRIHFDATVAEQARCAPDDVDAVFLKQEPDAGIELVGHGARARHQGLQIDRCRPRHDDAKRLGLTDRVEYLG